MKQFPRWPHWGVVVVGGVRGRAPSFVEFSTGVRSWKAVLSWVEAAVKNVELGSKFEEQECENWCSRGPSASALLAAGLDSAATDA